MNPRKPVRRHLPCWALFCVISIITAAQPASAQKETSFGGIPKTPYPPVEKNVTVYTSRHAPVPGKVSYNESPPGNPAHGSITAIPPSAENTEFEDDFDERLNIEGDEGLFRFSGHLKNLAVSSSVGGGFPGGGSDARAFSNLTRLRLTVDTDPYAALIFHGDLDQEFFYSDQSPSPPGGFGRSRFGRSYNEPFGGGITHGISSDTDFSLRWHRLYLKYTHDKFTVTAGRQLVRFGTGKLWNPLDILNPINPSAVEGADENRGIDALKVEYFPGESTELSFVYAPNREEDRFGLHTFANRNTNLVMRLRTSVGETDLAVLGGRAGRKNLLGGDVAAVVKEGILRGSIMQAFPDDDDSFILANLGYEYTFRNGIYFLVEYFYNGNALNENPHLKGMVSKAALSGITEETYPFIANQFITFNSHYFGISMGYDITPLIRGDIFAIYDVKGDGLFFSPSLRYNLLENLDLSFTAMFGFTPEDPARPSDFDSFSAAPLLHAYFQFFF